MDLIRLLFIVCIAFGASFIQRVSGFGLGIFAMTFLPYIMSEYTEANVLTSMISLIMSFSVVCRMFGHIHWKNLICPLIGNLVLTHITVNFMSEYGDGVLRLLLGIALVLLSIYFIKFSEKVHIRATWYTGLICGCLSGVLGGLFSMGGPPIVIYYMESESDHEEYMATIQAYFFTSGIYSLIVKSKFITPNVFAGLAVSLVGILAGVYFGKRVFSRLDGKKLKKLVYVFMALSGLANIVTALLKML